MNQPYVGLRPFERNEHEIFFGRDKCVEELQDLLVKTNFFAVIGEPYCGKTSLVRCGLETKLLQNNEADSMIHWHIASFNPNANPFFELADSLLQPQALGGLLINNFESLIAAQYFVRQKLTENSLSLHALLEHNPLPENHKLLLVCDQFEEIFHLWLKDAKKASDFVNLLINSCKPPPLQGTSSHDIYVVITMRSAYLDKVALSPELEEVIRNNIYLTPRLNKGQLREAILKPPQIIKDKNKNTSDHSSNNPDNEDATETENTPPNAQEDIDSFYDNIVAESHIEESEESLLIQSIINDNLRDDESNDEKDIEPISPKLADYLLNIVDASKDQLPLLQHLLMRMWEVSLSIQNHPHLTIDLLKKPSVSGLAMVSSLEDEEKYNLLDNVLSLHLDRSYDTLKEGELKIAEVLFRKLMAVNKEEGRPRLLHTPVKLDTVVKLTGASIEEVMKVIDIFREPRRAFLTPPYGSELSVDSLISISHESIVRHWDRLETWKKQEMEANKNYHLLNELAHKYHEEGGERLKQPLLNELLDWCEKGQFTNAWAQHYDCNFNMSEVYLLKSKKHDRKFKYIKDSQYLAPIGVMIIGIIYLLSNMDNSFQKDSTLEVLYEMRENLITPQNSPKLEKTFEDWTINEPDNINAWLYYGLSLNYQQNWKKSEAVFRKAHEIAPDNKKILLNLIDVLINSPDKKVDEALDLLSIALEKNSNDVDILQQHAYLLSHQNEEQMAKKKQKEQLQVAVEHYKKILSIESNDKVLTELGLLLSQQNKMEEAFEALNQAVELDERSIENWKNLGLEELKKGTVKNAVTALTKVLDLAPEDDENWRNLGRAYLSQGNLNDAKEAFEKAIQLNKAKNNDNDENYKFLADVLMQSNKLDEALIYYDKALAKKVTKTRLLKKSELLDKQNKKEEARKLRQQALSIIEDSSWE